MGRGSALSPYPITDLIGAAGAWAPARLVHPPETAVLSADETVVNMVFND